MGSRYRRFGCSWVLQRFRQGGPLIKCPAYNGTEYPRFLSEENRVQDAIVPWLRFGLSGRILSQNIPFQRVECPLCLGACLIPCGSSCVRFRAAEFHGSTTWILRTIGVPNRTKPQSSPRQVLPENASLLPCFRESINPTIDTHQGPPRVTRIYSVFAASLLMLSLPSHRARYSYSYPFVGSATYGITATA